ncbi:hypothetical protein NKH57_25685 [Mesorhizobium sp. M1050]|uniref:hypothetical protein n=1 Tax=Mesorhizobium sp. M1050 TaxID=2957051 RepID=UPI00333C485A
MTYVVTKSPLFPAVRTSIRMVVYARDNVAYLACDRIAADREGFLVWKTMCSKQGRTSSEAVAVI